MDSREPTAASMRDRLNERKNGGNLAIFSTAEIEALLDVADAARQLVRRDISIEVVALCEANLIAALAVLDA